GNAACVYNGKSMHHGTLLFSADLSDVEGALRVDPEKMQSKGIKSVRSRVINIAQLLETPADVTEFMTALFDEIKTASGGEIYRLSSAEANEVNALANEKYRTDEWNYGSKSDFNLRCEKRLPSGCYDANLLVENGAIKELRLYGDYFANGDISALEKAFCGVKYDYESIVSAAKKEDISSYLPSVTPAGFAEILGK
ncbi:MAG: lipoate--protein ligase, partial [Clostridia bacterium]|nr:lipoate--protein ligase [Clostridia bacterium]